jgi:hypothetical protein
MDSKDHMVGVIVNQLLGTDGAQDKLVELVWGQFTDEQKKAIADRAYETAMTKVGTIVEQRLWGLGSGVKRTNLFANHVARVVKEVFETQKVSEGITVVVTEHLNEAIANLKTTVKSMSTAMIEGAIEQAVSRLDIYAIRESLQRAFKARTEEVSQ